MLVLSEILNSNINTYLATQKNIVHYTMLKGIGMRITEEGGE